MGIELTRAGVSMDSGALIEAIKLLAGAVPYIGVIVPTLSDILQKPPDEIAEIKSQLLEMDSHLFAIENKIDALSQQINDAAILSHFKSKSESIGLLQKYYRRYIEESNNVTLLDLRKKCTQFNILDYVYYVEDELGDSTTILPLMSTMMAHSDLANFQRWMKMLTASISQSMILHTSCMLNQFENDTALQNTTQADIIYFQKIANLLLNVTENGTKHIHDNFFEDAKSAVNSTADLNDSWSHEEFATSILSLLQERFYFRNWFVFSYDPVWTAENHMITTGGSHVYFWFRIHNRNIQITHTNNVVFDELAKKYSNAALTFPQEVQCDAIYDSIKNQIEGLFNSIAVLQSTELSANSFYAAFKPAHAFHMTLKFDYIVAWRNKLYEVYIVPGEK